ncbi:MAG: hypothetical protein M9939_02660 [Mesorhizobium sp.]|nr:hypothetical protein [Mesorhizobium sp.]MCO5160011.1 hypothetical protein [Mesorhizobium sp.]
MPEALSDDRWLAIRELCEGEAPTHVRVARACGVYVKTISARAGEDGWKTLDFRYKRVGAAHRAMITLAAELREGHEADPVEEEPAFVAGAPAAEPLSGLPPAERIARMGAILARRTEAMLMKVEAGQPLEGRQVAALSGLVQLAERIAVLAREEAGEKQRKSDEKLADVLRRIDRRIVELAYVGARFVLVHQCGVDPAWVDRHFPEGALGADVRAAPPAAPPKLPLPRLKGGGRPPKAPPQGPDGQVPADRAKGVRA